MSLAAPGWLLLALPLGTALWLLRLPGRTLASLRALAFGCLILGLAGLAVDLPRRAGTVVVVVDRSRSMPPGSDAGAVETTELVRAAMGPDDRDARLGVVSFAESAALEQAPQHGRFAGFIHEVGADASNLDRALELALASIPAGERGRLLVLSDGSYTGHDPQAAAGRAAARGIPIDYRPIARPAADDLAIAAFEAPSRVGPREVFPLTAWLSSPVAQELDYELERSGSVRARGRRRVPAGRSRLALLDSAEAPTTLAYTLRVSAAGEDPVPENNQARHLVEVRGPRSILLLSDEPDPALARLLRAGGLDVTARVAESFEPTLEALAGHAALILEDSPAERLGETGMQTIAAWVRHTGAGLMLTGGPHSFGPGGYFGSPLEPILPVSLELREEHRKLSLAIVVALDRSGSMAVTVADGRTKMALANLGAAEVLELLSPVDEFGLVAVDSLAHTIVPLAKIEAKQALRQRILSVESMGGGIFVFEALAQASDMLLKARAKTRHIILFADAADAEEPGEYRQLLEHAREAGITCSVIGLGTKTDPDAWLLRDVALLGGGEAYFTDDAKALPRLFAQDTFVVARSAFIDEPTPIKATPILSALSGRVLTGALPSVGGYDLTYLREGAQLAVVTLDEYHAPLVAAWQVGAGRTLALTAELDGPHTGDLASWPELGSWLTGLVRWTAGDAPALADGAVISQKLAGSLGRIELELDPARPVKSLPSLPRVTLLTGTPGRAPQVTEAELSWSTPDSLAFEFALHGSDTALATVTLAGRAPERLPPITLPYSPELAPALPGRGLATLKQLARATGGTRRLDLAGIWQSLPRDARAVNLAPLLFLAAALLLLGEVLERRTGLVATAAGALLRLRPARREATADREPAPRHREPAPAAATTAEAEFGPAPDREPAQTGVAMALEVARQRAAERTKRR